jgi:transcriptional regulator with XRE-family HTH domain
VDAKREIQEFLTSRRGRITPEQASVRTIGSGPRRVPGLRREEVASLAGVSIAYYTKLERGDASGASDTVLEALSRALQLDDAERAHLFDLVRAQQPVFRTRRRRRATQTIRPGVQPDSASSTHARPRSSSIGSKPPTPPSPSCAPKRAAPRTTRT